MRFKFLVLFPFLALVATSVSALEINADAKQDWQELNVSSADRIQLYRKLYSFGFLDVPAVSTDFELRLDVLRAVKKYQQMVGAKETGFLTKGQVRLLLANPAPLTPWEKKRLEAANAAVEKLKEQAEIRARQRQYLAVKPGRRKWEALNLNISTTRKVYRALFRLGFATQKTEWPDFSLRKSSRDAVSAYQKSIGAKETGYLNREQVDQLLPEAGEPFPWEHIETVSSSRKQETSRDNPFLAWKSLGYSQAQKRMLYRALYNRGFLQSSVISIDLTSNSTRAAIKRYQAYNGAEPTGYLSKKQAEELLADPGRPTAWERNKTVRKKATGARSSSDGRFRARAAWKKLQVSKEKKRVLYRALYDLGFTTSPKPVSDFAYRMEIMSAVEAFQSENGFEATGFLNEEQIKILLQHKSELTPYELENVVFEKYGKRTVLNFLKDIGEQEYEGKYSEKLLISTLERRFSLPFQGYVTEELVERLKTIPLEPKLGEVKPYLAVLVPLEVSHVKDWRRWEIGESYTCETGTGAIEVEGFLGSASVPSVHFLRDQKWPLRTLDMEIELVNWDLDTVSTARIGGRNYYIAWDGSRYIFTKRDGSELVSEGRVYADFVRGLIRSNGFEVKYQTVFGNDVIASFSALGFSKQLQAIRKNCRR